MFSRYLSHFKYFDWLLFLATVILGFFSLMAMYSIAKSFEEPNYFNLKKQIFFWIAGLILVFAFSFLNYNILKSYSLLLMIAAILLLIAVLLFGITLKGTTGWLSIFKLTFQPVELVKLALIIYLASFFSDKFKQINDFKFIIFSGFAAGLLFFLTVFQPDFGSAILLFFIWFFMVLVSGIKRRHLILITLILIIAFCIAWFFFFKEYQKDRILTFIDPERDPYNRGYQVKQAVIAVGSGGLFGRGLGLGSQSQLKFLPVTQTDFIFAVISEELGFLGAFLVIGFYALFFYRLIVIIKRAPNNFAMFLVLGISILLFSQFFINVGMNIGLLPVTGIGLPFVSYGGSFLIVSLIMVGIAESVAIRSIKYKA